MNGFALFLLTWPAGVSVAAAEPTRRVFVSNEKDGLGVGHRSGKQRGGSDGRGGQHWCRSADDCSCAGWASSSKTT